MADIVWQALGQPKHYIEPFFGSGAVLLARPGWTRNTTETVNDKDGFIANVWRALQFAPGEVAKWCDWPVNHADLMARKAALIKNEERLLQNLCADPEWHDPVIAGYWVWAASCWVGSGLTRPGSIPDISRGGMGVNRIGQIPHIANGGKGVQESYNDNLYLWFRELSERLRGVRVVCGEWDRVCGGNWQDDMGVVGMFFDPPYGVEDRDSSIYHHDTVTVAADVREWVRERGKKESYRIVLAGYEEYDTLLSEGWTSIDWKASGGYGNQGKGRGKENAHRERLYFSPHCLSLKQRTLF